MGKTIGNETEGAGTVTAALRRDLEEILGRVPTDQEIAAERGVPTEVGTALEQISLRERIREEFQKARRHAHAGGLVDRLEHEGGHRGRSFAGWLFSRSGTSAGALASRRT